MGKSASKQKPPQAFSTPITPFSRTQFPCKASLRLHFLWTKAHSSLYRKLSRNIAREICLYLEEPSDLLYYESEVMYRVHPLNHTTRLFFDINILLGPGSVCAAVLTSREEVFMVLRNSTSAYEDYPYYMIYQETLRYVPGCREDKFRTALLYDLVRDCVYIFGGQESFHTYATADSRVCEKFLPSNCSIERLPDMLEPRVDFGVCWHLNLVYLCGGTHPSIETFNPRTLTYTKVCDLPGEISGIVAFPYLGALHLLRNSAIWKETAGQWQKTAITSRDGLRDWRCTPYSISVVGHYCSYLSESQCVTLDLHTFARTSQGLILPQS